MNQLIERLRHNRQMAFGALGGGALALLVLVRAYGEAGSASSFLQFTLVGISGGCVYAVAASGLVLTYTTTGVFNFAHGAIGMAAAFVYYQIHIDWDVPTPIALALILLVFAPLVGLILERIMRSFRGAPPGTALTVTIALTILLIGVIQAAYQAHGEQRASPYIWGDRYITIFDARLNWDEVTYFVVAIVAAIGLRYLLKVTRVGVAMRAVVDNPDLAALTGAPPITIARTSWVLGSVLASRTLPAA